ERTAAARHGPGAGPRPPEPRAAHRLRSFARCRPDAAGSAQTLVHAGWRARSRRGSRDGAAARTRRGDRAGRRRGRSLDRLARNPVPALPQAAFHPRAPLLGPPARRPHRHGALGRDRGQPRPRCALVEDRRSFGDLRCDRARRICRTRQPADRWRRSCVAGAADL
ncbi:MAG: hypothetical protein AVDCRST_MAG90-12, partial [uncultured Microvirga sp.]